MIFNSVYFFWTHFIWKLPHFPLSKKNNFRGNYLRKYGKNNYTMYLQIISSKSFDGSWDSYHSIIEHLLATVIALMDTFISSRPWNLRWSTYVLVFASVDSWITWFIWSWEKITVVTIWANSQNDKCSDCKNRTLSSVWDKSCDPGVNWSKLEQI